MMQEGFLTRVIWRVNTARKKLPVDIVVVVEDNPDYRLLNTFIDATER